MGVQSSLARGGKVGSILTEMEAFKPAISFEDVGIQICFFAAISCAVNACCNGLGASRV